jgi:hypothetical protein
MNLFSFREGRFELTSGRSRYVCSGALKSSEARFMNFSTVVWSLVSFYKLGVRESFQTDEWSKHTLKVIFRIPLLSSLLCQESTEKDGRRASVSA